MKSTIKLLAVFALMLATFSQHTDSAATNVYKFKGKSIHAYFSNVDLSGCVVTTAFVFASEQLAQYVAGAGIPSTGVELYVSKYNQCTEETLISAENIVPVPQADLNISGSLRKAVLKTTVNVYDAEKNVSFEVFVDLSWTGTDTIVRQNTTIQYDFPDCRTNDHSNSTFHFAQASGTVSDGTTNFSPDPSTFGTISLERSGEISINCGP